MANRANSLYIISVLKEHSDETHPLSIKEIETEIKKTFFLDHPEESPNNSTIRRILAELREHFYESVVSSDTGISDPLHLGFCIGCFILDEKGAFVSYQPNQVDTSASDKETPRSKTPTLYYYYKNAFEDPEIELLISALEAHNYLSAADVSGLVTKLAGLSHGLSDFQGKVYKNNPDPRMEDFKSYTLEHMRILHDAIQKKQFANIVSCYYNEKHVLVPYTGKPKMIRPIRMMFNNGYYYLIAVEYSSKKNRYFTVHYRIDRLGDIETFDPDPSLIEAYRCEQPGDPATYRLMHPVMFGDDLIRVRMLIQKSPYMLNTLTDFFGSNAKISSATNEDLQRLPSSASTQGSEWLLVTVQASKGGMELFATEYCRYVCVLSPEELRLKVTEDLKTGLAMYE